MAEVEPAAVPDAEIFRSIETTVRDVLLPALPDDEQWARAAATQLVGLARYAAGREPDATAGRVAELAEVLATLVENPIVGVAWDGDRSQRSVMAASGAALAAAVGRNDPAADQIRALLRPVIVRQLDDELRVTAPLVDTFRGKLDG